MEEDNPSTRGFLIDGLGNSQRAWIRFREDDCEFSSRLLGEGTGAALDYGFCIIKMTKERVAELKQSVEYWRGKGY